MGQDFVVVVVAVVVVIVVVVAVYEKHILKITDKSSRTRILNSLSKKLSLQCVLRCAWYIYVNLDLEYNCIYIKVSYAPEVQLAIYVKYFFLF